MAYTAFDETNPATSDTGSQFVDNTRYNLLAVRDALIFHGMFPEWDLTVTTPGAEPDVIVYDKGTERVKLTFTWSSGRPATIKAEYSSNSGSSYDPMGSTNGLLTMTYDVNGFVSTGVWS